MSSALTFMQPSGDVWTKIRQSLNENVDTKHQDLAAIKEWLKKQPHLPDEWEDTCIYAFLRGCNYSIERCKKKLDMFCTVRNACPEFYINRDITKPEVMDLYSKIQIVTLPGLTSEGRRVTIVRILEKMLDTRHIIDCIKFMVMIADIRIKEETDGIDGDVYLMDASILTPSHIAKTPLITLKKFMICAQEAYPVKIKGIHIINTSPLVDIAYNVVKLFLKEKLRNRIFFHNDISRLLDYIPEEILPTDFGGKGDSMEIIHQAWMIKFKESFPWFETLEKMKVNEALRSGEPTNYDELFGVDGSFRQLTID